MDALQFKLYLTQPSRLAQLSWSELDTLVEKYPFCAPLRFLLLKKYQIEQPALLPQILPQQASYAPDGLRLHEFLNHSPQLNTLATQDQTISKDNLYCVSDNPPCISAQALGIQKNFNSH